MIGDVEQKLKRFTHLSELNNAQLEQLRQIDTSRQEVTSEVSWASNPHKVDSRGRRLPQVAMSGTTPTIKLKNLRVVPQNGRDNMNLTPQIAPASTRQKGVVTQITN